MTRINTIEDLPEKYKEQVEKHALLRSERRKGTRHPKEDKDACKETSRGSERSKYGNIKTNVNGIKFDSQKEARRYHVLMAMQKAGDISELRLQVNFTLMEGFTTVVGVRVKPIVYKADFTYRKDGEMIVEDVKSEITRKNPTYALKKKLMANRGYMISEV